jgi:ceramide glucosyltransferase
LAEHGVSEVITAIGWALLAFSLIGALYTFASGWAVGWFFSRQPAAEASLPPVTILKPLHGDEPGLRACLEGFCTQDYPSPIQIIFGVRDPFDPAIQVVRALAADFPRLDIEMVIDDRVYGANLKISNLVNMERLAKHPVIVVADSDVSVSPDYLRRLAAALSPSEVGYVSCAFVGVPTGTLWSKLSAMAINYHFLPSVAFGLGIRLAKPCFGPTMAFRRDVLDQAGGFIRFVDHLADDYEIGQAIRDLGYGFAIPPMTIGHGCPERSGRSLITHELRWARTIRLIDPASYAGSIVCHPAISVLAAVLLLHGSVASLVALGVVCLSRIYVMVMVDRALNAKLGLWWMAPIRDLLSVAIYLSAYVGKTVMWRGRRFRIGAAGKLIPHDRNPALARRAPVLTVESVHHAVDRHVVSQEPSFPA